jgi:hypothetical protein
MLMLVIYVECKTNLFKKQKKKKVKLTFIALFLEK